MNHHDSDQLLNQVLGGQEVEALRQATLEHGLAGLRLRRHRRHLGQTGAVAGLFLAAALLVVFSLQNAERRSVAAGKRLARSPHPALAANQEVKVITDDQLFALFPNRPLALIGKPGHQQLVFLDRIGTSKTTKGPQGGGL